MHRQHDHHRIGTREMRGFAGFADAAPGVAGLGHLGLATALGAKPVTLMPVDHAARLRQDRGFFRDQQSGNRAHVDELVGFAMQAGDALVAASRITVEGEMRNVVFIQPQEDAGQSCMGVGPGEIEPTDRGRLLRDGNQRLQFAQQQETRILARTLGRQPFGLAARIAGTVEMRSGEADGPDRARFAAAVCRRRGGIANHSETLAY